MVQIGPGLAEAPDGPEMIIFLKEFLKDLDTFQNRENRPSGTDLDGRPRNRSFAVRLMVF